MLGDFDVLTSKAGILRSEDYRLQEWAYGLEFCKLELLVNCQITKGVLAVESEGLKSNDKVSEDLMSKYRIERKPNSI